MNLDNQTIKKFPMANLIQKVTSDKHIGKLPPKAEDLEESILGAIMLEKDALTQVIDTLKPENFYREAHQEIYKAILQLFNASESIDLRTVIYQLKRNGKLDKVGGSYYISKLTVGINSGANIGAHAHIVIQYAIRRALIGLSTKIQNKAYDETTDVFTLLDKAEQSLFDISDANIRKNYAKVGTLMGEAFQELDMRRKQKDGLTGIPSGMITLDRLTSGWQKSDLIIIAARPGMGKTAFMLSALRNAAIDHQHPVAIFSLEMAAIQLANRLISSESEIEGEKIKKGQLKDYEWEQLMHKTNVLHKAPIYIDDTPALSIFELRAKCRKLKAKHDIQLIVIDYLQLMSGDMYRNNTGNREQEIASISRSLKNIAKELNIPVIALSQLSRAVEVRGGDKRPQLSDLRESGSIEQDADMVLFLYRASYYGFTEDDEGNPSDNVAEVIVAKHRNGSLGKVNLKFLGKYTKFSDLSAQDYANNSQTHEHTIISSQANKNDII